MKIKEIDRTANIAWSPAAHHPIYLAAGTAAQQLDATFSTTAALEIYALNLTEPGLDMCMKGSVVSDFRFHKVIWGCEGMKSSSSSDDPNGISSGVIVGGADGGNIMIYDAAKLIRSGDGALLHHNTKHTGPVHSLDFNKFQDCLLASGATESEIFIWDLNNPASPVTLGAKSQPPEDVTCVAWNCQVQHILASTFPQRCVVWDLRKNEPIIKVSDSSARLRCKVVAWHPEVATQLCLASEDDHSPLIQLWDLRFATSPLKTLNHHQRGVLSLAWCPQDPDLLLSCGKDNKILCWNPNSTEENGEVLCELTTGNQWSFDVAWCPRNPAIIANSSCDGHVGVFSLMGGQQQVHCSSKIAESFPGSEKLSQPLNVESIHRHISMPLQKPPKWLRKPVGASFGFGGKLVYFGSKADPQAADPSSPRWVHIYQVVTEPELLSKSEKLEQSLSNGNLVEFCLSKIESSQDEQERITWSFLQATFSSSPRTKMLSLLGYDYERVMTEVNKMVQNKGGLSLEQVDLSSQMADLSTSDTSAAGDSTLAFDSIAMSEREREEPIILHTDPGETDGLISQALLTGNIQAAVEICINDQRWADALVLAQAGGLQLLQKTQKLYFKSLNTGSSKLISAVVTSDWVSLVQKCDIGCWKEMLAAILTYAKPEDFPQLCELLGRRLEMESPGLKRNAFLCYISAGNLELLAQAWAKTHQTQDIHSLQCLIEQVMILRRAVEQLSGAAPPLQNNGMLSSLLGRYAELLATQGSLNSAVTYLVDPNEKTLSILRDRIYQALGHRSPHFPFQRVDVRRSSTSSVQSQPVQHQRHSSGTASQVGRRPSFPYHQQHPTASSAVPSQSTTFSYGAAPLQNVTNTFPSYSPPSYQPPVIAPPQMGSVPPVAPPPLSPAVPPPSAAMPPPPSETPQPIKSSGSHLSHRYPRHLHDPSVYSESSAYNPSSYYNTLQPQQGPYHPPQPADMYQQQQQQHTTGFYQAPEMSQNSVQPQQYMPPASSVPSYTSSYMPTSQTGPVPLPNSTLAGPLPPCYSEVQPAWNDPPPLRQSSVKSYEPAAPIFTPFPDMPAPVAPSFHPHQQQPPFNVPSSAFVPPQAANEPPNIMPSRTHPEEATVPEVPKEKGPIPPEHQVLQDIFEDLRRQCQQRATNPQMRRKLDDVAKKLENLYDKLRDGTLSSQVSHGLHQIVQAIMQGDYGTALSVHGHLVQNANFSEISGFMPSIKVLLQTASQLSVFLHQ